MAIKFLNDGDFPDNAKIRIGDANDLQLYHDGANSYIDNNGGDLYIMQDAIDKDIIFQADNGSGVVATYFFLDGSNSHTNFQLNARWVDNANIQVGNSADLVIFHNGTNSEIQSKTGNLNIKSTNTDGDIKFFLDDNSGSTTQYVRMDGGANQVLFFKETEHQDNVKATFGNAGDLEIYHNGTDSYLENATGDFYIDSNGDDLILRADDDVIIQSQGSENAVYCTGNAGVQIYHNNSEKLETKSDGIEVTGNIDIASNGEIELDGNGGMLLNTAPSGNEGNGIIIKLHSSSTTAGKLYFKSNFAAAWSEADADSDGATRMLGVALGSNSGTSGMLLQGLFRKASHGFSAGAPLYVSTTSGAFTTTAPSGSGDYVRVVGYVVDSNIIYFNPSGTWVEVS